jgi:hypothetical protein
LGEASVEEAHRVRFFSLSLLGPAFTWFSSLTANSIVNWSDLEKKFHTYFYTRTGKRKIINLTNMKQRTNESGVEFLQRFRKTKNLCFSLNLTDDQLATLAVQGMLPAWREKLLGQEFDNLGQLAQRVAALNSQFQNMRRETRFQKNVAMADAYNPYLVDDDEEEEIVAAEWNWGKKTVMAPKSLGKRS